MQVYGRLQAYVRAPEFLAKLVAARQGRPAPAEELHAAAAGADVRQPEWWQSPTDPAEPSARGADPAEGSTQDEEAAADGFAQVRGASEPHGRPASAQARQQGLSCSS